MDDATRARTWQLVFDATIESIKRTRRTLVVIISLVCISLFHVYMWYASWDLARIAGRQVILEKLTVSAARGTTLLGSRKHDAEIKDRLEKEILELEKRHDNVVFELPLLGSKVNAYDFPVAAQIVGVAVLSWLLFNQKRLNFCLTKLESLSGWGVPKNLLELNFGLIGSHADKFMSIMGRLLPLALPLVSALFVMSDLYDLQKIQSSEWQRLAFEGWEYKQRVYLRLGSDLLLGLIVFALGLWSYSEWRASEEHITRFSREPGLRIVNADARYSKAKLIEPVPLGYIYIAATVGTRSIPRVIPSTKKSKLLTQLKELARSLEHLDSVVSVTVFSAVVRPGMAWPKLFLRARGEPIRLPRFDVGLLIETTSPESAFVVQETPAYGTLLDNLRLSAQSVHVTIARNAKRVGGIDGRRGLVLFNHFIAEEVGVGLEFWDYLADWWAVELGFNNSIVLVPFVGGEPSEYSFISESHGELSLLGHLWRQVLTKSFRRYVLPNLEVNRVGYVGVLYRIV